MTTNIDLDALQALAEKAGASKWTASGPTVHIPETDELAGHNLSIRGLSKTCGRIYARHIAAANPQTILSLIARIRDLESRAGASAGADKRAEFERLLRIMWPNIALGRQQRKPDLYAHDAVQAAWENYCRAAEGGKEGGMA